MTSVNIPAEELQIGDTILLGGYADQAMPVVRCEPAGRTRIHVTISSGITFSYRRRESVVVQRAFDAAHPLHPNHRS